MKKTVFILIGLTVQLTAFAQLKVRSNGNVSIKSLYFTAPSPLTIGNGGDSLYNISCIGNRNGIKVVSNNATLSSYRYGGWFSATASNNRYTYGIRALATNMAPGNLLTTHRAIGVEGHATTADSSSVIGLGVYGKITGKCGAGVCGQSDQTQIANLHTKYAGLFIGNTNVVGDLTVTGTIRSLLTALPQPSAAGVVSIGSIYAGDLAERMARLNPVVYYQDEEAVPSEIRETERSTLKEQALQKKHFGLTAEQLEEVFPDLVYQDADGTKSINYMEMIPMLVQRINELQTQVNILAGKEETKNVPAVTALKSPAATSQAVLCQNTPNPFTERTEIRFSLPEETANAAICIFDMSGKMLRQIPISSGMQSVAVAGYELSAGMYLYSLVVGGQEVDTKRMILSK